MVQRFLAMCGCERRGDEIPDEIEVTSEMIEAAERLLFSFDPERCYAEDCLREIFLAMEATRRRGHPANGTSGAT